MKYFCFFLPLEEYFVRMKKIVFFILFICSVSYSGYAQSVGLVLSGGGAKGLSHIGVIKALEENDIPIDYICGTSMGAIVGGLYSIGLSPDEMLALFRSPEFESWYKGMPEQAYANYFYRDEPTPKMFKFSFFKDQEASFGFDPLGNPVKRKKWKVELPTSLVSPYPMDLAVMQIFASPSAASKYDFNNLMVPFFCVASDIVRKEPYVMKKGDLGASIRASMTYPFYFKPIMIDSTLLFDGGFYNNFPWDIMAKEYAPDFMIGAKCVVGESRLDEDDVVTQISNMLMVQTDYQIPEEKGLVIGKKYPYGIMDFHKVDEIVEMGYKNALPYIAKLKEKIKRERSRRQMDSLRLEFRERCREVRFHDSIEISGNLNGSAESFVDRTIRNDQEGDIDFNRFKWGYYRVIASNTIKTFYPTCAELNDSLFVLRLKVTKASPFRVDIGGNISSSSLNQGYVGFSYSHLARSPWRLSTGLNIGKYYKGVDLRWRHDIGVKPLAYYDAQFVAQQFDFYSGNQNIFTPDKIPNNVQQREMFFDLGVATPVNLRKNVLLKFGLIVGREQLRYYTVENFSATDRPDKDQLDIISPSLSIQRNTHNYLLYPTEGKKELLSARYSYASEAYTPGTTSFGKIPFTGEKHYIAQLKFMMDSYVKLSNRLRLGILVDVTLSTQHQMSDYLSTLLRMPVFSPIPHSKTLMLQNYRADNYIGVGISPVFLFTKTFYLHTTLSYFQAYKQLIPFENGKFVYSDKFPRGGIIANMALVWQSPVGPVSFSASYYERGEYNHWYPQLNIGFLLFRKKILED